MLIIDDEPAVRAVTRRMLERSGYVVREASDGAEALTSLRTHGVPDLVITDLMMPGMGGHEIARRMHARWPDLPVLFMSGHALSTADLTTTERPMVQYIQKPFTIAEILEKLDGMLETTAGGN